MISIKEYVAKRKEEIKEEVKAFSNLKLVIIQIGDNPASNAYIKGKLKDCDEVGIKVELIKLAEDVDEHYLLNLIDCLNADKEVTGLIVQLPLPKHISEQKVIEAISPEKDVDGFSKLAYVNPGTPQGIIDYLEYNNYNFVDKNAVVIGRSNIVGRPIARLLLDRSCNVSVIHSKTSVEHKQELLKKADLVVVATGHRNTIVNEDLELDRQITTIFFETSNGGGGAYQGPDKIIYATPFIVDVGMNRNDEGKLCGDCEAVTVCEKTPVPGGVGLLTRLALITNLMKLAKRGN